MEKERELTCDCGKRMREKLKTYDGIRTRVMVCPKCGYSVFTKEQAEEYLHLKELQKSFNRNRKIIRIGNSKGITLPDIPQLKLGDKIKIEVINPKTLKLILS